MSKQSQNWHYLTGAIVLAGLLALTSVDAAWSATRTPTPSPSGAALRAKQVDSTSSLQEERIEDKREQVRENLKERQEELSGRLARDKQEIAVRMAAKINALNQRLTSHYTRHLQRLSDILDKIAARAERVANTGADVEPVTEQIAEAREHIATAQEQVDVQAKKVYEINLAEAEQFGQAVRTVWQQFTSDHQQLRQGVLQVARQAVHVAFQTLRLAVSEIPTPTATP